MGVNPPPGGLVGNEVLTDTEIWGVIYVWNQLHGAGILSDFNKLHLMSLTSELNAKVDFITPLTADLAEIANGGVIDWTWKGFASDGLAVMGTGYIHSASTTDIKNTCTFLYVTEDGGEDSGSECGVVDTLEWDTANLSMPTNLGQAVRGRAADIIVRDIDPDDVANFLEDMASGLGRYPTFTHLDSRSGIPGRWSGA